MRTDQSRGEVIFFSTPTTRGRCDLILRLGKTYLEKSAFSELSRIIGRVKRVSKTRNMVAHCIFLGAKNGTLSDNKYLFMNVSFPDNEWTPEFPEISLKELHDCQTAIEKLCSDITTFLFDTRGPVHVQPSKWRELPADSQDKS
jgi:hypothetical protein